MGLLMGIQSHLLAFKRDHPINYWVRLFLAVWIGYQIMAIGFVHADHHTADINEVQNYSWGLWDNPKVSRAPNNTLVHGWIGSDNGIYLSWSEDNGTSWTNQTVVDGTWKTLTYTRFGGVLIGSNNTTYVYFASTDTDHAFDTYLAIQWNGTDSWEITNLYGHATPQFNYLSMAINNTDCIIMTTHFNSNLYYRTYNPSTNDHEPNAGTIPTVYIAVEQAYNYDVSANMSGDFYFGWRSWSGSFYQWNLRDMNKTESTITLSVPATYTTYFSSACLLNDIFIVTGCANAAGSGILWYWAQSDIGGAWGSRITVYSDLKM